LAIAYNFNPLFNQISEYNKLCHAETRVSLRSTLSLIWANPPGTFLVNFNRSVCLLP
jgi:hypothetical protein